jgi:hypothetical protein
MNIHRLYKLTGLLLRLIYLGIIANGVLNAETYRHIISQSITSSHPKPDLILADGG